MVDVKEQNLNSKRVNIQLGDQRGRLEEQQLSQVDGVGSHHKQPYFAANMGPKDININLINRKTICSLAPTKITSNSGGGQYLTITSCVGSGN